MVWNVELWDFEILVGFGVLGGKEIIVMRFKKPASCSFLFFFVFFFHFVCLNCLRLCETSLNLKS